MSERKFITYRQEFKEDAVRHYLQGGKSYRQNTAELGIKDAKTLRSWSSKVGNGKSLEEGRGKAKEARRGRPKTKFSSIEEELAYVKSERDFFKARYKAKLGHDREEETKLSSGKSNLPLCRC
ncbi:transposase [Mailhella sp.]|uniref:transposase n=1 Tax=Mailhella sp. TaxID=1981029 RepID=UPI004064610B